MKLKFPFMKMAALSVLSSAAIANPTINGASFQTIKPVETKPQPVVIRPPQVQKAAAPAVVQPPVNDSVDWSKVRAIHKPPLHCYRYVNGKKVGEVPCQN